MTIAREEIFGPVLSVLKFKTAEEVVQRANSLEYGLSGGVFSKNINTAINVAEQLESGLNWVNTYTVLNETIPFGGFKQSGYGRENGSDVLASYLENSTIVI